MLKLLASETLDAQTLLLRALGMDVLPDVVRDGRGKPRFSARPDLHFNVSHSGPYALCGLSDENIGVDIETIRPRRTLFVQKVLSPGEYQWYLDRGGRWPDFYSLWTLKEARVKHSGRGLDCPPRTIAVPLLSPGGAKELDGLTFTLYGGNAWRAAVCTGGQTAPLEWLPSF